MRHKPGKSQGNERANQIANQMLWKMIHPKATVEMLGFIPSFLSENDPDPAKVQFDKNYIAGWFPFPGFKFNKEKLVLNYPGDPPTPALAETMLRDERVIVFQHAWVMILQKDGSFEISRLD